MSNHDSPHSSHSCHGPLLVVIDGKQIELYVVRRQGIGLICQGASGIHFVLESHAVDKAEFRRRLGAATEVG